MRCRAGVEGFTKYRANYLRYLGTSLGMYAYTVLVEHVRVEGAKVGGGEGYEYVYLVQSYLSRYFPRQPRSATTMRKPAHVNMCHIP